MESRTVLGFRGTAKDMVAKKGTQLFLLAEKDGVEVVKQTISANRVFRLTPGDYGEAFEFIYILKGEILHKDTGQLLGEGDYLLAHNLEDGVYFQTVTSVTFLTVTNSPIFYDQKSSIEQLLKLTREVEEKDQNTEEHCERLQEIAAKIGQKLGLTDEDLFHLVYAALLHDVGKNNVPESVLIKPGSLTDEEWEIMRQHPRWGKEIILDYLGEGRFSKVAQIVLQHHEKFDGTGYPSGLKGDEILLESQILAITDAYDAIISERPYKKAIDPEEACRRLAQDRDRHFKGLVVDAFLEIEPAVRKRKVSDDSK